MARRSVSLPSNLERTVRRLQATLLTAMDRDISFTETLNLALAAAFAVPDLARRVGLEEWQSLLEGSDWDHEGMLASKKREILGCISDQHPAAASQDAELDPQPSAEAEGPVSSFAYAPPAEVQETAEPISMWPEPGVTASVADPVEPEVMQVTDVVAPPAEMQETSAAIAMWPEPAFTASVADAVEPEEMEAPEAPEAFDVPTPLPEPFTPFAFTPNAETREATEPLATWDEPALTPEIAGPAESEAAEMIDEPGPEDAPPPSDSTPLPSFLRPVSHRAWNWTAPSPRQTPEEPHGDVGEAPPPPASESDAEGYDDLARALGEAAAAYEETLRPDGS